jgi:hypothetical protein
MAYLRSEHRDSAYHFALLPEKKRCLDMTKMQRLGLK